MSDIISELALKWANGVLNINEVLQEAYEAGRDHDPEDCR